MPQINVCSVCRDFVVGSRQDLPSTAVVADGWRHLDDSPLCPAGVPTIPDEPDSADADATAFTAALSAMFASDGARTPERAATALAALQSIAEWLQAATDPLRCRRTFPHTEDLTRHFAGLLHAAHAQAGTLVNLSRYLEERARTGDLADVAFAGRIGGRLAHAAALQVGAAADLADCWLAARHHSTTGGTTVCGCPPVCACCAAAISTRHDPDCPWQRGSAAHEEPAIAPEPTVLPVHLHRAGCPQAVRRPGGLFEAINASGDVQCLTCAAVNTLDGDSFDSERGTAEHHHHRCTACGGTWSWCTMRTAAPARPRSLRSLPA